MKVCVDAIIKKIEEGNLDFWELAESLLVVSSTMEEEYIYIMMSYIEHEDGYVRDVVQEYLTDIKRSQQKK